jgi:hypothetical protein
MPRVQTSNDTRPRTLQVSRRLTLALIAGKTYLVEMRSSDTWCRSSAQSRPRRVMVGHHQRVMSPLYQKPSSNVHLIEEERTPTQSSTSPLRTPMNELLARIRVVTAMPVPAVQLLILPAVIPVTAGIMAQDMRLVFRQPIPVTATALNLRRRPQALSPLSLIIVPVDLRVGDICLS